MQATLAFATLISVAAARFSGTLDIYIKPDGSCNGFDVHPADTAFPRLSCAYHYGCTANGNEIASFSTPCRTNGLQDDATIAVRPHDQLQFCRAGFCTCMSTQYQGQETQSNGIKAVHFAYNDDQAKGCAKW